MGFKTNYCLMQVESIAECSTEHSVILTTFIKLPFVIKIFVLSILEWPLKTGFTVFKIESISHSEMKQEGQVATRAAHLSFLYSF